MPYVNEIITPEDRIKYGLDKLDTEYGNRFLPMSGSKYITIDRERESYIRLVKVGRHGEDEGGILYFSFYWKQETYVLKFKTVIEGSNQQNNLHISYYIQTSSGNDPFNNLTLHDRQVALQGVKEALIAFKENGLLSKSTQFKASFNF